MARRTDVVQVDARQVLEVRWAKLAERFGGVRELDGMRVREPWSRRLDRLRAGSDVVVESRELRGVPGVSPGWWRVSGADGSVRKVSGPQR